MISLLWALYKNNKADYFVSLKTPYTKVYKGPSHRYPVTYILMHAGYPLHVRAEYDHWLKVEDRDGSLGWIHHSFISRKQRSALVVKECKLLDRMCTLQKGCIVKILSVEDQRCFVQIRKRLKGWIERKVLWGVQ